MVCRRLSLVKRHLGKKISKKNILYNLLEKKWNIYICLLILTLGKLIHIIDWRISKIFRIFVQLLKDPAIVWKMFHLS